MAEDRIADQQRGAREMAEAHPSCEELRAALDSAKAALGSTETVHGATEAQGHVISEMVEDRPGSDQDFAGEVDRLERALREAGCE